MRITDCSPVLVDDGAERQRRAGDSDAEPGSEQRVVVAADGFPVAQVPLQHPAAQRGEGGGDGT